MTTFAYWVNDPLKRGTSRFGVIFRGVCSNNDLFADIVVAGVPAGEDLIATNARHAFLVHDETKHVVRAPSPKNSTPGMILNQSQKSFIVAPEIDNELSVYIQTPGVRNIIIGYFQTKGICAYELWRRVSQYFTRPLRGLAAKKTDKDLVLSSTMPYSRVDRFELEIHGDTLFVKPVLVALCD
jgi:hypothetical protein